MKLASKIGPGWSERQGFRWLRLKKRLRQWVKYRPGERKTLLFIVGCQRSGTSMIHHLFRLDWDTVTYDEISPLSADMKGMGTRLDTLDRVANRLQADRAPLVVCKPLVESQNLDNLLAMLPQSKAIWMYRDYRDVVKSNLEYFGSQSGHRDLEPILAGDETNWRAERLGAADRELIRDLYTQDMTSQDAAALFWYARNSLFFSGGYACDSRVKVCCYEDLVTDPHEVMSAAYTFLNCVFPGDRIIADVVASSRGRGRDVTLSPQIQELCGNLLDQLNQQRGLSAHASD